MDLTLIPNFISPSSISFLVPQHRRHLRLELVIAWCKEDIEWLLHAARVFSHVIIYSKCHSPVPLSLAHLLLPRDSHSSSSSPSPSLPTSPTPPPTTSDIPPHLPPLVDLVNLPNIGTCDHTYLYHIVSYYETLAKRTIFFKGTNDDTCPLIDFIQTNEKEDHIPNLEGYQCCKRNFREERANGFYPFFTMKNYTQRHHQLQEGEIFYPYEGDLGLFLKTLIGRSSALRLFQSQENRLICYGGYFSAQKDIIHRQSVHLYELLLFEQKYAHEEVLFLFSLTIFFDLFFVLFCLSFIYIFLLFHKFFSLFFFFSFHSFE